MSTQPLPPGRIRPAFAPITRPAYCTCDAGTVPHVHHIQVDTYDATVTDRTDATDAEFEARLERLDRLEVADESAVEIVARAIWDAEEMPADKWTSDSPGWAYERQSCHRLAHIAIAALKPAPGTDSSGQAVEYPIDLPGRYRIGGDVR